MKVDESELDKLPVLLGEHNSEPVALKLELSLPETGGDSVGDNVAGLDPMLDTDPESVTDGVELRAGEVE